MGTNQRRLDRIGKNARGIEHAEAWQATSPTGGVNSGAFRNPAIC
jgi:hypothetical protein